VDQHSTRVDRIGIMQANAIWNRLAEEKRTADICCVVVDEVCASWFDFFWQHCAAGVLIGALNNLVDSGSMRFV